MSTIDVPDTVTALVAITANVTHEPMVTYAGGTMMGLNVGTIDGDIDGTIEGKALGDIVGKTDGMIDGVMDGDAEGVTVGKTDGTLVVGNIVGAAVGGE